MHRKIRNGIFFVFLTIFVIGAPVIVLYTAGYRLNLTTFRVQRTGVVAITTLPRGASVTMNNVLIAEKTPYVVQRLTPGDYDVLIQKAGYQPWAQHVTVGSGSTMYITALLFSDTKPELLLEESALSVVGDRSGRFVYLLVESGRAHEVWRYDTVTRLQKKLYNDAGSAITHIALNFDESTLFLSVDDDTLLDPIGIPVDGGRPLNVDEVATAMNALPEYSFFDNGSNVEMRLASTDELVTLLPPSTYTVAFRNSTIAILKDTRDRAYLVNLNTQSVSQIDLATALLSESPTDNLLAASDGNEIDVYNPQTGERTFIARQSEPILALTWHSSDRALLFATATKIIAIERDKYETRETTTLVDDGASIIDMWPDTTGKSLTFFGTVGDITGIWKVVLTQ